MAIALFVPGFLGVPARADLISNPTTDFSLTNGNPNGLWSYGMMNAGFTNFQLMPYIINGTWGSGWAGTNAGDWTPTIWLCSTSSNPLSVPVGWLALHPASDTGPSVLRWTDPGSAGQVSIQGQFLAGDRGTMSVGVRFHNTWLWQASDHGSFNVTCSPSVGDHIDFVVYGAYDYGTTPLEATITYNTTPEPATLSLMGLGLGGLALLRKRRKAA